MKLLLKTMFVSALFGVGFVQAQDSVNSGGGDASGVGGSVAYSIGQVFYTTESVVSSSVSQGVQHAFEIFTIHIVELFSDLQILVYPNPTLNNITLEINVVTSEKYAYQLHDARGNALINGQVEKNVVQIYMEHLPVAAYFLTIFNVDNEKVRVFKIIKKN
jgi:hypothetical protein